MRITILSIATDRYVDYIIKSIESFSSSFIAEFQVEWIVFTDQPEYIESNVDISGGIVLKTVFQEHWSWPYPTLLRYKIFEQHANLIDGDVILYLDADMLFDSNFSLLKLVKSAQTNALVFISHPGYYRPNSFKRILLYLKHPRYFFKDVRMITLVGGIGSWELRKESQAYVERQKRKIYVCGGVWFGQRNSVLSVIRILSSRVERDLLGGVIATFHDESHLNWYASNHEVTILGPSYCFDVSYPNLVDVHPQIFAVNKNLESAWIR